MFELFLIVVLFIVVILIFKSAIKALTMKPEQIKFDFKVYFINGYNNYNPVKIQKGECLFKVKDGKFYFEQNGNVVEDNIFDIYNIRTWTFENYTYIAIKTKTSSEYKFSLMIKNDAESSIEKAVSLGMLKTLHGLCNKLKIDFVECGESQPNNDGDDHDDEDDN